MKMKTLLVIGICLLCGCGKQQVKAPHKVSEESQPAELSAENAPTHQEPDAIDETLRLAKRKFAAEDLLSAHQAISMYEIYAEKIRDFIANKPRPLEIALLQDDLNKTTDDIRQKENEVSNLKEKLQKLSEARDPSYELEIAIYLTDLAKAKAQISAAKRKGDPNHAKMEAELKKMHQVKLEQVLSRDYKLLD